MNIYPKGMANLRLHNNAVSADSLLCLVNNDYGNNKKTLNNEGNKKETNNCYPNLRSQLFSLNNLSMSELKLKWIELYKSNPNNFQRGYLVRGLAYKIQSLYGMSDASEDEIKASIKTAKQRLKTNNAIFNSDAETIGQDNQDNQNSGIKNIKSKSKNGSESKIKTKKQIFLPPIGSVISTYHNNIKYMVKILDDDKFSYDNKIYKSLSAIANEITGTRWSGYAFFHLK
jgi:hypothetical protein